MKNNFDILRLACLMQDVNNQDFKKVILSIIFEILYENNNEEVSIDSLYQATISKSKEIIERDFFDSIIMNSKSFIVTNSNSSPSIKLTSEKSISIEKTISDFSIETSIVTFLSLKKYDIKYKESIINILYQSIYENIYLFNPLEMETLVPDVVKNNFSQLELNIFNEFLEHEDAEKNKRLYNQFVKAIEFAILTSGKGVKEISENLFKDKTYILDTNIILRMLGIGGEERMASINKLIESCIKQGVKFEYTLRTFVELNKTLDSSINKIKIGEQTKNFDIIGDLIEENPHFYNDDFIIQYSKLRQARKINSPEQYSLFLKSQFKTICAKFNIEIANHKIKIEEYEVGLYANKLISERKKITSYYRYLPKQAQVDAYNILYVNRRRGSNNFNYSEVKSFYLTTDRGLNKILAMSSDSIIPATILPSQLFAIHNPLNHTNSTKEVDYENFFSFLKRRTSEFKHRGRDIFGFINQARVYTSEKEEIKNLIVTFTDERYNQAKDETINENVIIQFKDFAKTYFDKKLNEFEKVEDAHLNLQINAQKKYENIISISLNISKAIDYSIIVLFIPLISYLIGLISSWQYSILSIIVLEIIKQWLFQKNNFKKKMWKYFFMKKIEKSSYFLLTNDKKFHEMGLNQIEKTD